MSHFDETQFIHYSRSSKQFAELAVQKNERTVFS